MVRTEIRKLQIRTVIVGPMPHHDAVVALLGSLLGRTPETVYGVDVWWGGLAVLETRSTTTADQASLVLNESPASASA